eukprot:s436_g18.t1
MHASVTVDGETQDAPPSLWPADEGESSSVWRHQKVQELVVKFWDLFKKEEDSTILKEAYDALVLRFLRIYLPGLSQETEATLCANSWQEAAMGSDRLDLAKFFQGLVRIAQSWCDSNAADDYVGFLEDLLSRSTCFRVSDTLTGEVNMEQPLLRVAFRPVERGDDMMLLGPGCLAIKPDLWRRTLVVPKHKQGLVISPDNWRFLEVRPQMGLLQEAVLINRIKPCCLQGIEPGQSGYVGDVSDAQLLLHELTAARRASGLPILTVMGDLARAFPRTWRDDFLTQVCFQAGLDGGGRGLLADMLCWDAPVLNLNGISALVKFEGHGLGIGCAVPSAWQSIAWHWQGVPDEAVVLQLIEGLQGLAPLPSPDNISTDDTLMASCLRAMDHMAASRVNLVLHADDPVVVCSSQGAAMAVLHDIARWAHAHKAAFHVGPEKTVALLPSGEMDPGLVLPIIGAAKTVALLPSGEMDPGLVLPIIGAAPCPIQTKTRHKWLGLVWPANLDFASALESSLQRGNQLISDIVSLLDSGGLPLCFALALFDAKVEVHPGGLLPLRIWNSAGGYVVVIVLF